LLKERVSAAAERIGLNKIGSPVFYNSPFGIRFEIGVGSPYSFLRVPNGKYVSSALQRAYIIYRKIPGRFDTLLWTLYPNGDKNEKKLLSRFCKIAGLHKPQERYQVMLTLYDEPDEHFEAVQCYWDILSHPVNIKKLLEAIIRADIGGFRELAASVYLFNTDLNVLYHLYDDRGLDVAAESRDLRALLYNECGDWIL
jgi:hypothetical protein